MVACVIIFVMRFSVGKTELFLFTIPLGFGLFCSSRYFASLLPATPLPMEQHARALAGAGAIDCGHVITRQGATRPESQVYACGAAAFKSHKPFYLRVERRGSFDRMTVGDGKGKIYKLRQRTTYDSEFEQRNFEPGGECISPKVFKNYDGTEDIICNGIKKLK